MACGCYGVAVARGTIGGDILQYLPDSQTLEGVLLNLLRQRFAHLGAAKATTLWYCGGSRIRGVSLELGNYLIVVDRGKVIVNTRSRAKGSDEKNVNLLQAAISEALTKVAGLRKQQAVIEALQAAGLNVKARRQADGSVRATMKVRAMSTTQR